MNKSTNLRLCILLLLAGFFALPNITAQKAALKRANKFYQDLSFQNAIVAYLDILDRRDVAEAKINVADCYRRLGNTSDAEYWYGQVVHLPEAKPLHKLYYGMALQSNNKCEQAQKWFDEYARLEPNDLRGQLLAKACGSVLVSDFLSRNAEFYEVKTLPTPINSNFRDFGPSFYTDGKKEGIVFASSRDLGTVVVNKDMMSGEGFLDAFFTEMKKPGLESQKAGEFVGGFTSPVKFSTQLNTTLHDGPFCFSPDGNVVFMTRTNTTGKSDDKFRKLKVYFATKDNKGNWSEPKGVPFNSDEYSVAHPSLSVDGKTLYFSSDMPTGFGGYDIYKSILEDGRWGPPTNLGPEVNTEGNEVYPFIHQSNDLYFACNGRAGLGGYDVFYIKTGVESDGKVYNMGYPVNSNADDFSFVMNADRSMGFFSSNRNGGVMGDDIFQFKRLAVEVNVLVVNKVTGKPIENAAIMTGCGSKRFMTDEYGKFVMELPLDKCCEFGASKEGFSSTSKEICTKGKQPGQLLRLRLELDGDTRREVPLAGVIRDKKGTPIANAEVQLINNKGVIERLDTTDDKGNYRFVVREDAKYDIKCDIDKYVKISQAVAVVETPKVETPPTIKLDFVVPKEDEVKKTSISFVLNNIYWDYGKPTIRDESKPSMDKLFTFLKDNPTLIVEIGAHTDSRGNAKANLKLSQQRAQTVVDYLVKAGVSALRMRAIGYGETLLINQCADGVKCSEEEHQRNRRTEFKVIGTVDGQKFESKSGIPERIEVDKCTNCTK